MEFAGSPPSGPNTFTDGRNRSDPGGRTHHSAGVRLTHWANATATLGLWISGTAILLAHPRLYWGETGNLETPSLLDLPLPMVLENQTGWGRSLHFLCAWICVFCGFYYLISGLVSRHFSREFLSPESQYGGLQRTAYLFVVFFLFPVAVWTGLAMSPAMTSVFPLLVTTWGGQQSARTVHFFVAVMLLLFLAGHVAMVIRAGFWREVRAMIVGGA